MYIFGINIWDVIIGIVVLALVVFAFFMARDRKKSGCCGSGGCDGNCSACASASANDCSCKQKEETKE